MNKVDSLVSNVYEAVIANLDKATVTYQVLTHASALPVTKVCRLCNCLPQQFVKACVIRVRHNQSEYSHYLAVVPGNYNVDLAALESFSHARYALFAPSKLAEQLTGCPSRTIPPFALLNDLVLIVDPLVLENKTIIFRAGRKDKTIILDCADYLGLVNPLIASITY